MNININQQFWKEFERRLDARLDAKLEEKLEQKLDQKLAPIKEKLDMVYDQTIRSMGDIALLQMDMDIVKEKLTDHDKKFETQDIKLDHIIRLVPQLNEHIYSLNGHVTTLEKAA